MLQVAAERAGNTALKNTLNAQRDETQVWVWGHMGTYGDIWGHRYGDMSMGTYGDIWGQGRHVDVHVRGYCWFDRFETTKEQVAAFRARRDETQV